jgi:hypothetical protein
MRKLNHKAANYWVCAYANRQHDLGMDIAKDPEESSFRKAMRMANGVLLILDESATPFKRIWCDFELYTTIRDEKAMDIVTMTTSSHGHQAKEAQLLSGNALPNESTYLKANREMTFPIKLLIEGMRVKLEEGAATVASDKQSILDSMAKRLISQESFNDLSTDEKNDAVHTAAQQANAALHSYFAQAAWPRAVKQGIVHDFDRENPGSLSLPEVLQRDTCRRSLQMSLGHMAEVDDRQIKTIARALQESVDELSLSFEVCHSISDSGLIALAQRLPRGLKKLHLDLLGCEQISDEGLRQLSIFLPEGLVSLRLDFAKCVRISNTAVATLAQNLPAHLKSFSATFKGTECNRNFGNVKDFRKWAKDAKWLDS